MGDGCSAHVAEGKGSGLPLDFRANAEAAERGHRVKVHGVVRLPAVGGSLLERRSYERGVALARLLAATLLRGPVGQGAVDGGRSREAQGNLQLPVFLVHSLALLPSAPV